MAITGHARPLAGQIVRQLVRVNVLDLATRLAAQAFLTALPMLIAVSSVCPRAVRQELLRSLRSLVGSGSPVLAQVQEVYGNHGQTLSRWGAVGVLIALLSATAFTRALQRVCELSWHLPQIAAELDDPRTTEALVDEASAVLASAPGRGRSATAPAEPLTQHELTVLRRLRDEAPLRRIAGDLFVSYNTVKRHTRAVYRKLGAHSRAEALHRARQRGLIR